MKDRTTIIERLTQVFTEHFATNKTYSKLPADYRLQIENPSHDLITFDLVATFRSKETYCCFEPGCHFGTRSVFWPEFRADMAEKGLAELPRLTIRNLRCVVEQGAMMVLDRDPGDPIVSDAFEYTVGPFNEP